MAGTGSIAGRPSLEPTVARWRVTALGWAWGRAEFLPFARAPGSAIPAQNRPAGHGVAVDAPSAGVRSRWGCSDPRRSITARPSGGSSWRKSPTTEECAAKKTIPLLPSAPTRADNKRPLFDPAQNQPRCGRSPRSTGSTIWSGGPPVFSEQARQRDPAGPAVWLSQLGYSGIGSSGDGACLGLPLKPYWIGFPTCEFWFMSQTPRPSPDAWQQRRQEGTSSEGHAHQRHPLNALRRPTGCAARYGLVETRNRCAAQTPYQGLPGGSDCDL